MGLRGLAENELQFVPISLNGAYLHDTWSDLYSVICASPYVYGSAFTGSKEIILSDIIENSLTSTTLSEALVAVRFFQPDHPPGNNPPDHDQRHTTLLRLTREAKSRERNSSTNIIPHSNYLFWITPDSF